MKRKLLLVPLLAGMAAYASAQGARESFQEFRRGLHKDYNEFRSRILEHYADFLEGEWHPYEPLMSKPRYDAPKPTVAPVAPSASAPSLPSPSLSDHDTSVKPPSSPKERHQEPETATTGNANDSFDFYGMPLSIQHAGFRILNSVQRKADTAAQWRALDNSDARKAAQSLKEMASSMGLNGYLTFRLAEAYLSGKFPSADSAAILSATHYLLANMGYDVRLAISAGGTPLLLMPFAQTVYGSLYLNIGGRNYTAFGREGTELIADRLGNIHTCQLPASDNLGKVSDLRLDGLKLPYKPYAFRLSGGGLTFEGEVNENIFRMLYRYPQMPTEDYAVSTIDKDARRQIVEQAVRQLGAMEKHEAVRTLMRFFHEGLAYATDQERHGFEKPYFLEETLYYDKCDCEDRAIMFTYIVWNALRLPTCLNAYPGHESAAVAVDTETAGPYSYTLEGLTFRNTDPTYIGSGIGDVMPQFAGTPPTIDKVWK